MIDNFLQNFLYNKRSYKNFKAVILESVLSVQQPNNNNKNFRNLKIFLKKIFIKKGEGC